MHRVLLALDPASALVGREALERDGNFVVVSSPSEIFDAILRDEFDLVIADLAQTDLSAISFASRMVNSPCSAEFILAVEESNSRAGLISMNEGAFDFVTLPLEPEHLRLVSLRALERHRLRRELTATRTLLQQRYSPARWLTMSALLHLREEVEAILPGRAPILLVGEPGTETTPLAHLVHYWSQRSAGPFVRVPNSIFPARELEEVLRGVPRSDRSPRRRPGWFERAHGGSLFFEDVTRLPLELQEWLASVIETGSVLPMGAATPLTADVRVICALHQSPEVAEANHRLHPGLWQALRHRMIHLPPLRDRSEEIAEMLAEMLDACGASAVRVTAAALHWLQQRRWPGNRTEFEATVLRTLLDRRVPDRLSLEDLVRGETDTSELATLPQAATELHGAAIELDGATELHGAAIELHGAGTDAADKGHDRSTARSSVSASELPMRESHEQVHSGARGPHSNGDESHEHDTLHLPGNGVDLVLLERQLIEEALDRTDGNQTHAARLLGLTRQTLIYRMQKYGIR